METAFSPNMKKRKKGLTHNDTRKKVQERYERGKAKIIAMESKAINSSETPR
jgi:hypothetical protein